MRVGLLVAMGWVLRLRMNKEDRNESMTNTQTPVPMTTQK